MEDETQDRGIVNAFVQQTSSYGTRKAGKFVNVSHTTVADWRRGEIKPLQPDTKRALKDYLKRHPATATDAARMVIREMRSKLDELEASLPPLISAEAVDAGLSSKAFAEGLPGQTATKPPDSDGSAQPRRAKKAAARRNRAG